jgi:hypothetical protein
MVFLCMQTRSPVNSDSPNLVKMVRVKPLSLSFGDYLSSNEAEVDNWIWNLMTINSYDMISLVPTQEAFYWIIPGSGSTPIGQVTLPVTFGTQENYRTEHLHFKVA